MNAAPNPLTTGQKDIAWRLASKHGVLFSTPGTQRFDDALFDFTAEALNDERLALAAAIAATPQIGEQIVLQPEHGRVRVEFWDHHSAISVTADYKTVAYVQRDHDSDEPWRWYGSVMLTDTLGREWKRRVKLVTDDFGNLVEVQ